jgi:hypothetical protein
MRSLPVLLSATFAVGCAAPATFDGDGPDAAPAAAYRVDGVVVVERVRTGEGAQTSVAAKFMRHASSPESAERLVGSRLLLPGGGECASVAQLEAQLEAEGSAEVADTEPEHDVALVDVGDVALVTDLAPSMIVRLAPRAFPDVGEVVSGVFYTSPDVAAQLPAPARYEIDGSCAAAVDAFQLTADAPAELGDVTVGGVDLASEGGQARTGEDLLITWQASPAGDRVYVDLQGTTGHVHRCSFDDTGSALVPASLLEAGSLAVAVHRLREVTMPMPRDLSSGAPAGAEPGRAVVRFDLAVVGRVELASTGDQPGG